MIARTEAFTLIEVLAATVLTAGLMMGVMAVVSDLGPAGMGVQEPAEAFHQGLQEAADRIAFDVAAASEIDASLPGRIVLIGYCRLDGPAGRRVHRPVRVEYRIETIGQMRCLVRYQQGLDVLTNQNRRRDLLGVGLEQISLQASRGGQVLSQWQRSRQPDRPPAGPSKPADASNGPVASRDQLNPYDSVNMNGLMIYIKYAPDWALIKEGLLLPRPEVGRNDRSGTEDQTPAAQPDNGLASPPPVRWRLQLRDSQSELDRTIWIQPEGASQ
ncbi:MAG: hypothetical protein ACLFUJ_05260 [Phycisphaerae bacterium]